MTQELVISNKELVSKWEIGDPLERYDHQVERRLSTDHSSEFFVKLHCWEQSYDNLIVESELFVFVVSISRRKQGNNKVQEKNQVNQQE